MPALFGSRRAALLHGVAAIGALAATSTLWLPYDGTFVNEGAAAGTKVAALQGLGTGTSRSITSVKNAAGTSLSTALFAVSGNNLVTGLTPTTAADGWYEVIVQEVGANTTSTPLYVYVNAIPSAPTIFTDGFNTGSPGDLLSSRPGWSVVPTGSSSLLTLNSSSQLATGVASGSNYITNYCIVQTNSCNHYARVKIPGTPAANAGALYVRSTDKNNFVQILLHTAGTSSHGPTIWINAKSFGNSPVLIGNYFADNIANKTGDLQLEVWVRDDKLFVYACNIGGTPSLLTGFPPAGIDISNIVPSGGCGLGAYTVAGVFDDFECGQLGQGAGSGQPTVFSHAPDFVPVYAVDPVALKAQIPVRMSFTGTAPTALQYRVEDLSGAAVTGYDWMDAANAVIGASGFSLLAIAPVGTGCVSGTNYSGNWRINVRDKNNTAVSGKKSLFGVGDVVLGDGQSNMQRMSDNLTNNETFVGSSWHTVYYPQTSGPGVIGRAQNTASAGLHNTMIGKTGRPCWFVNLAYPGVKASYLSPGDASGWFNKTVTNVIRQFAIRATAIIIRQGETDCDQNSQSTGLGWVAYWQSTINSLLTAMSQRAADVPIGIALTGPEMGPTASLAGTQTAKNYLAQRKFEKALVASYPSAYISHHAYDMPVNQADCIHIPDANHLSTNSVRYAYGILKAMGLGGVANDLSGPKVTGVLRPDVSTVRLVIYKNGCSAISAPGGTAGVQIVDATGFDGSQDPNSYFQTPALTPPLAITGGTVTDVDANTAYLDYTLSTPHAAPVAVRYPASTSTAGSVTVFDAASPFGASNYQPSLVAGTGVVAAPSQIVGTGAPDGSSVGLLPITDALAA